MGHNYGLIYLQIACSGEMTIQSNYSIKVPAIAGESKPDL
jgi:hypothetical protein